MFIYPPPYGIKEFLQHKREINVRMGKENKRGEEGDWGVIFLGEYV